LVDALLQLLPIGQPWLRLVVVQLFCLSILGRDIGTLQLVEPLPQSQDLGAEHGRFVYFSTADWAAA